MSISCLRIRSSNRSSGPSYTRPTVTEKGESSASSLRGRGRLSFWAAGASTSGLLAGWDLSGIEAAEINLHRHFDRGRLGVQPALRQYLRLPRGNSRFPFSISGQALFTLPAQWLTRTYTSSLALPKRPAQISCRKQGETQDGG